MTAPLFITNDADIAKLEGIYIKETDPPAGVTESSLNVVGIFGTTLKGPVGTPVEITSEARFVQIFGGGYIDGVASNNVWKSLLNKGFSKTVITRVGAPAAVKASFTLETAAGGAGTAVLRVDASSPGVWGNKIGIRVFAATNADANYFNLEVKDNLTGTSTIYENLTIFGTADNTLTVLGNDLGNLITLTKLAAGRPVNHAAGVDGADTSGFVLLGQTVAAFTSVPGTDGTVADADYFGTGKGLDTLADYKGVAIVFPAEYMSANLKAAIKTKAAASSDRLFLMGATDDTVLPSAAVSDVASYRSDRVVYTFNHPYTLDPVTGAEVLVRPESWMACVLANTDVDIHPGEEDTKRFLAGITKLKQPSITRQEYVDLRAAGISAMEVDLGSPVFVSGRVTDLTPGKTEITRRRMADFLQLSAAYALRFHVKKKGTTERRRAINGLLTNWLNGLARAERVVDKKADGTGAFQIDNEVLNNPTDRANGIERVLMRVKIIGHMLHIVLQTEIGTGVTIAN